MTLFRPPSKNFPPQALPYHPFSQLPEPDEIRLQINSFRAILLTLVRQIRSQLNSQRIFSQICFQANFSKAFQTGN